ncbi:MAG: zinc ribbon domain-containing protein [Spirochaetia bacterium]|nr:zinc ribbon domain-containing protein [Spirochaetia bacterium]
MTKCVKCGGDITEGAKFCSYCGTPVESGTTKDETKERTQVFVGTIRKCPNCGEQIGTNTTKCPACGFVIEKRNVSASLDDFVKKLASFDHYAKKREYIENYPVPNNKEDIRDLLTYAASQRDKDYDDNVAKAYWVDAWNNKCRQIVNQAFDTFGMDEDFASWLRNYKAGVEKSSAENEKRKKKLRSIEKGKKRAAGAKKFFKAFGIIVVILAVLGGAGFGIKSCSEKEKEVQKKILEGYTIPKENVSLGGILGTYCEVISDAKITFPEIIDFYGWYALRNISVQVRFKEDLSESYKRQAKELLNGFDEKEYGIKCYDSLKSSFGRAWSSTYATDLFSAKKGSVIALTGSFIAKETRFKHDAKKAIKDMANNPLYTVTLSIAPELKLVKNGTYTETIKQIPLQ